MLTESDIDKICDRIDKVADHLEDKIEIDYDICRQMAFVSFDVDISKEELLEINKNWDNYISIQNWFSDLCIEIASNFEEIYTKKHPEFRAHLDKINSTQEWIEIDEKNQVVVFNYDVIYFLEVIVEISRDVSFLEESAKYFQFSELEKTIENDIFRIYNDNVVVEFEYKDIAVKFLRFYPNWERHQDLEYHFADLDLSEERYYKFPENYF